MNIPIRIGKGKICNNKFNNDSIDKNKRLLFNNDKKKEINEESTFVCN